MSSSGEIELPLKIKRVVGRPKKLSTFYKDGEFDQKAYYLSRKEHIKEKNSKRVNCDVCARSVRHDHLTNHKKTKLCQKRAILNN